MWKTSYFKQLRDFYYCKSYIKKDTLHKAIHRQIKNVPLPQMVSAKFALDQLKILDAYGAIKKDDDLDKKLNVLIALFECVETETTKALKKQLKIVHEYEDPP